MKKTKIFAVLGILICMLFAIFTGSCAYVLEAPTGFDIDDDLVLSWTAVENARNYEIEIKYCTEDSDKKGDKELETSRKTSIALGDLEVGSYEIRVKSIAGDRSGNADSPWSKIVEFEKKEESGCLYTLKNNREYEVTKLAKASGDVYLGDEYRNRPVTSIGDSAFKGAGATRVTSVVIGKNVTRIGEKAFYNCLNLQSVVIPESVTYIGASAFQSCKALKEVTIPDAVTYIEESTFTLCSGLEKVTLGNNLLAIGEKAFSSCKNLKEINIPDSVKQIDMNAFCLDESLEKVTIGAGVKYIYNSAFEGCTALSSLTFSEGGALEYVGFNAFSDCDGLTSVTIPEGVTEMANYVFANCNSLEKVDFPESMTILGNHSLSGTKLYNEAKERGDMYVFADNWVVGCPGIAELEKINRNDMPKNITGIANGTFTRAPMLAEVDLPLSIQYVGTQAFYNCPKLWKLVVEEGNDLIRLGQYAFGSCAMLKNVFLSYGLEEIDSYCFYKCTMLDNNLYNPTVLIPESVTSVGTYAFNETKLWNNPDANGIIYAANWVVGYNADKFTSSNITLRKEEDSTATAKYLDTVGIADFAFYNCEKLQTIAGLNNVKYLGAGAFYGCKRLASVTLNSQIKEIKDYTFFLCQNLYEVSMPRRLEKIGFAAFYRCGLGSVDLSGCNNLESIGSYSFFFNENLSNIQLGENLTEIPSYSFYGCAAEQLVIPDSVETIGQRAFSDCKRLIKINFGENSNLKNIGTSAFNGSSLVVVNLPNSVENIGTAAFMNCQQLVVMNVGEGVQTIGNWAFSDCYSLEALALSDSLQSIGKYAFNNCANLPSILLTNNIQSIGEHAFFGCTNITVYTDLEKVPLSWNALWNSSSAVVVFNAQFEESEDGKYVTSVEIKENSIVNGSKPVIVFDPETGEESNVNPYSAKAPFRVGYKFLGWATSAGGEVVYSMNDILDIPVGTTLYAVWEEDATYAEYIANTIRQKIEQVGLEGEFDDIWDNIYNDPYYGDYDDSWQSEEELGEEFLEKLKDLINN